MTAPDTAMVLAAGLGTRMRPITNHRPKALVEVAGRTLIDRVLDRLVAAGVTRAVVNVHAFADDLEAHLRQRNDLEILISDERAALLETGGGLKKARALLGDSPIVVANIDSLWLDDDDALTRLVARWDGARMDSFHLLAPLDRSLGFSGPGDFFLAADGSLTHRGDAATAPFAQAGFHILDPRVIEAWPDGAFSAFPHWLEMARRGRLHGLPLRGLWMHVGDPAARREAEARL